MRIVQIFYYFYNSLLQVTIYNNSRICNKMTDNGYSVTIICEKRGRERE